MAITIRKLSEKAESILESLVKENNGINTKTKAIEHALSNINHFEEYFDKYYSLERKYKELLRKHNNLVEAIKTVNEASKQHL